MATGQMLRQLFYIFATRRSWNWRLNFCAATVTTFLMTYAALSTIWRSIDFPKLTCPPSSGLGQDLLPSRRIRSSVIRHFGNWSFEEPARLARLCRPAPGKANSFPSAPMSTLSVRQTLLAIVPMTGEMAVERDDLRKTWGAQLNDEFGQLLFLLQLSWGSRPPTELKLENQRHQDILIAYHSGEDSGDSYDLLVRKMIAALRWYAQACSRGFEFVLKADYDSYWNVASLVRLLRRHRPSEPLVLGSVQEGAPVSRDLQSKFYVSKEAHPGGLFPPYASGGPGYVMSRAAAVAIAGLAEFHVQRSGALWLEDVYITGVLPALGFSNCNGSSSLAFLHLHSDYIFICRYQEFTASTVRQWPPLAMHQVRGRRLHELHDWLRGANVAAVAQMAHYIVYSRSSCPDNFD